MKTLFESVLPQELSHLQLIDVQESRERALPSKSQLMIALQCKQIFDLDLYDS